jgi:DNA-binding NarL/FixJ family response regulator
MHPMDPSSTPAPIQVWIAEDHSLFGQRLMRALNRHPDIDCPFHFSSGEDTLAALESHPAPTVLLLDLDLPGMGGGKALPLIREKAPHTAVVVLTVFEDDEKIFQCICSGASGYLLKTAGSDGIADAVRTAASGGSPITPSVARRVLDLVSRTKAAPKEHGMTPREMEMLRALSKGLTLKEAAAEMGISYHTADDYVRGIYRKLEVRNRSGAVAKAIQEGWVSPR